MRQSRSSGSFGRSSNTANTQTERKPRSKLGRRARQIRRQNGTHNPPSASGLTVCGDDLSWTDHSRRLAFNGPKDIGIRKANATGMQGADSANIRDTGNVPKGTVPVAVSRPVKPKFRKGQKVSIRLDGICAPQSLMAPNDDASVSPDSGTGAGEGAAASASTPLVKAASVLRVHKGDGRAIPTTYDMSITHELPINLNGQILGSGGGSDEGRRGTNSGTQIESPSPPSAQLDCVYFGIDEERISMRKLAPEGDPGSSMRKCGGLRKGGGLNMSFRDEPTTTHVISPRRGSETPAALALVLTSRLRRHLRRSWCAEISDAPPPPVAGSAAAAAAALKASPTRRPTFAEPGLWRLLCSDPPSSSFESADDRREEASHAAAHLKQILDAMEFGDLDNDGDTDGTNADGEDARDDDGASRSGDDRKFAGSSQHPVRSNSKNQESAQHVSLGTSSNNASTKKGAGDNGQEHDEEKESKEDQENMYGQAAQSAEENAPAPLTATKWMPGDADYPGEVHVAAKPQMVVPASACAAAAIVNVDSGDDDDDHDNDHDDDDDETEDDEEAEELQSTKDKQSMTETDSGVNEANAVKERVCILSAMEASTVALELRVLLSACWRAALPPPPPPGSLRPQWSGCNYWYEANCIILRAWRLCRQEHRPEILDAVARTAPATDEIDFFFKGMFPTPNFTEGLVRQASAPGVAVGIGETSPPPCNVNSSILRKVSPTKLALKQLGVSEQYQANDAVLFGSSRGQTPADLIDAFVVVAESLCDDSNDNDAQSAAEDDNTNVTKTSADHSNDCDPSVVVSSSEVLQFFASAAAIDTVLGVDMPSALPAQGAGNVQADDAVDRHGPCRLEWLSLLSCCATYHQCVCDIQKAELSFTQALSTAETSATRAQISLGCARAVLHRHSAAVGFWMQNVRLIPVVAISTAEALVELLLAVNKVDSSRSMAQGTTSNTWHRLNQMLNTVASEQDSPATLLQVVSDIVSQVDTQLWKSEGNDSCLDWIDWHSRPEPPAIEAASASLHWPSRVMQKLKAGPDGLQSALPCGAAHDTGVLSQLDGAAASGGPPEDCMDKAWQAIVLSPAWQVDGHTDGAQGSTLTSLAAIRFLDCVRAAMAGAAKARLSLAECYRLRDQLRTDTRGVTRYEAHLEAATGYEPRELREAFCNVHVIANGADHNAYK